MRTIGQRGSHDGDLRRLLGDELLRLLQLLAKVLNRACDRCFLSLALQCRRRYIHMRLCT